MAYAVIVDNEVWDKFAMLSLAEAALYNQKLIMKEMVAQKKAELKRAAYEDDGWQIIEYHHHFLKGVLAVKEVEKKEV